MTGSGAITSSERSSTTKADGAPDTGAGLPEKVARAAGRARDRLSESPEARQDRRKLRDARRHSQRVQRLRIFLPVLAILLIAAVFGYAAFYRADDSLTLSYAEISQDEGQVRMTQLRFNILDADGRPATVSADEARQVGGTMGMGAETIVLSGLQADLTMPDGGRLSVIAPEGVLDRESETMRLTGGISLFTDAGYELLARAATIEFAQSRAVAEGDVRGLGPFGEIASDRLVITDNGQNIRFEGNVRSLFAGGEDPALAPLDVRPPLLPGGGRAEEGAARGATGDG
jgi:lipopolysaccharide export system protein LptC